MGSDRCIRARGPPAVMRVDEASAPCFLFYKSCLGHVVSAQQNSDRDAACGDGEDQHCAAVPLGKALGLREAECVSEVWLGTEAKDSECVLLWGHPASCR